MRTPFLLMATGCLLLAFLGLQSAVDNPAREPEAKGGSLDLRFQESVRPFLATYCLGCHGKDKPEGDLDLSAFTTEESVARALPHWELVVEQLEAGSMPPAKAKLRPTDEARASVVAWIKSVRQREAKRNAGDPGLVPARRLSNAEYDHTIRDLTGVDLRPTREFPVDPANEAGFDNSAESLAMSPALVKKYLQAAREVADHLVLKPDGLAFATHPMLADTDRDKYCVNSVIDFYKRQRTDYADYFFAAWRFRHREALGQPDASLARLAAESGLSPKYLATIWATLTENLEEVGPTAALQTLWRELPPPDGDRTAAARSGCERMRDYVVVLRRQLTPEVKNLTARGIDEGSQPLVLWKNRQYVANRMRYEAGGASKIRVDELALTGAAAKALASPEKPEDIPPFEATFPRFCRTFPDAFFVSERARVYLDGKEDKKNTGRLLNAGFHSMTGYFRDDEPLAELMLDEAGQRELERLWREFDFVTGAPMRQYSSYLWYERAESGFLRDRAFDFIRAEDKDAASEAKIQQLAEVYLAKVSRLGASELAYSVIKDQFGIISASIRRVEQDRVAAVPRHIEALQTFAERAYRRPLSNEERDGIAAFYRTLREQDELGHDDAVRDTVVGVLMSPYFCYRVDLVGAGTGVRPLSDYDLASRLSYFLWASMPDRELLDHAAAGDLHLPEVLVAQARRMLRDDRVRGLATEFSGNWLDFRRFEEHNSVDRGRFPTFDDELRRSMFEEPIRFFVDLVRNDRSVHEFLDGKHTFVNPSLARHYGMPEPDGWVRVDDAVRFGRGGLLPMAVFLTKNAPGLRTSPVKRGYWVVRRLLGENIPAPPPDVPDLPDDEAKLGDLTLRQTLARHRADKSCAGCHERFDAIGLAFEGFGPVGEARDKDLGGRPVDVRATFPGGSEGAGLEGLRRYLDSERREEFVENLCRKLLSYALGRSLLPSDDETIDTMRTRLAADGHRFGSLIESIVASPQFLNKRVEPNHAE
ncbi:DUF1592 domain-containing protein [Singulisphaera acidiphila]|uniref:Cytochrome c domain-containing protein n=1 Tax=Singulisphaera acidiphila (strain ATCC BAA-1392 / DSM 18658 / VKM B-2454 / MOB10) TaxID=886293 RepID=L0DEP1_SINAD|nr:DUF1592 domain-containing protein [Singulisphaera acidiphila]AGA27839.1 Protein of unknown function (DUF1587)/Protein of unknown function (DUF1592)/Protein of unknown function (DUF1595)/Protein of unknown function (DUF1588)/Protein of unknown function (DUF1585) [Singulisphaera acidiphila DSM 18658]